MGFLVLNEWLIVVPPTFSINIILLATLEILIDCLEIIKEQVEIKQWKVK